jgi:hypothetical protein
MNGRAIPGAYLFCLYVCDKEMSWPHHIGETHQPKKIKQQTQGKQKVAHVSANESDSETNYLR